MPIHLRAKAGDVAELVLLPGDPDRARAIAEAHLSDVRCYNDYRQLLGFTGRAGDRRVSVQTTGMGAPSAAIVIEELVGLGAGTLVRIGTCGAIAPGLALGDSLLVERAWGDNGATRELTGEPLPELQADPGLLEALSSAAAAQDLAVRRGSVASLDLFYDPDPAHADRMRARGAVALEMEASMVFAQARRHRLKAACLLTVSDLVASHTRATPAVIQAGVDRNVGLVLAAASL